MQISGAVAVVTGASRGIGRATALELARRGATVVASARDEAALAELTDITHGTHVAGDVTAPGHAARLVDHAVSTHGRLDVVVANAGIGYAGDFATMPVDRIQELIDVNVRAPVELARAAVPVMVAQRRGSVVFVTSIAGAVLVARETVYSMTKAAIEALAPPLRDELHGTGVSVSTVLPGVVDTEFFERRGEPYDRSFPRPISADQVAQAVVTSIVRGTDRIVTPRWLGLTARLHAVAPHTFRALSRRFG